MPTALVGMSAIHAHAKPWGMARDKKRRRRLVPPAPVVLTAHAYSAPPGGGGGFELKNPGVMSKNGVMTVEIGNSGTSVDSVDRFGNSEIRTKRRSADTTGCMVRFTPNVNGTLVGE